MSVVAAQFDETYPAFSWVDEFDLQCTVTQGASTLATVGASTTETDGFGLGASNQLPHQDLGDAIVSNSGGDITDATATLFTSGTYTDGIATQTVGNVPVVRLTLTLNSVLVTPPKIVFQTVDGMLSFGYEPAAATTKTVTGAPRAFPSSVFDFCTTLHWNGIFTTNAYDRRVEYIDANAATRRRSEFDETSFTTVTRNAASRWLVILRDVHERYLTARHATDTILADVASTSTDDTYSTLDRLIDADLAERDIYLALNNTTDYPVSLDWTSDPSTDSFASPGSAGRRFWTLRIPCVEQ